jgi:hypothetical protein
MRGRGPADHPQFEKKE